MIFQDVRKLEDVVAAAEKARNDPNNPHAAVMVEGRVIRDMYAATISALQKASMVSVEDAARAVMLSPEAYRAKAAQGDALLIAIEGHEFVPTWSINKHKIDPLVLDIAREFAREGRQYFRFMDMIEFMEEKSANVAAVLPRGKISDFFYQAGMSRYKCSVTVMATMAQLTADRTLYPEFAPILFEKLNSALTHGGWEHTGGLSRAFRDKYNIPGLTLDEAYEKMGRKRTPPSAPAP